MSGRGWAESWVGASGKVHKWKKLGGMAFERRGIEKLVKVAKNENGNE